MCEYVILILTALALVLCSQEAFAARQGTAKAKWESIEGDSEEAHEEVITSGSREYKVKMSGEVDGVMTRMPISYSAYHQGWQPNRLMRIENIGDTDIVNPWISINGKRNWRTVKDIADEATAGFSTERDKARAIWEFQRSHRFHATTWGKESDDAAKVYNIYGYTLCGNDANVISDLWKAAGLKTRRGYPVGHSVAEAFYDGEYHLLDGDEHAIYLRRDNKTIASEAEVVRDHDLVKRTHTYGISKKDSGETDESSASLYGYEGERKGERGGRSSHSMEYTLRPGESMEWRWDHSGKEYTHGTEAPDGRWRKNGEGSLAVWGERAYDNMRNGIMCYVPDLEKPIYRKGLESESNIAADGIRPDKAGQPAQLTWRIANAYVIVGGKIKARFHRASAEDLLQIKLSSDGEEWKTIWTAEATGDFDAEVIFDGKLSLRESPQYEYLVQVEMEAKADKGDVGVDGIEFVTDVQMSLLGMPELELGENLVKYVDETEGPRQARITHSWIERTAWRRPSAPRPTTPANDATVEGTLVKFGWDPPDDQGSGKIEDYHFQLSHREDMRWPMSPNFDKQVSKTASRGKTEWMAPYVGLLNPDTDYYWRVRAKNADDIWGPWSEVSSFKCVAPGVPINVKATADADAGTVVLTWDANPEGRKPVMFKVYGSDEKGFSVSDTEYMVVMGRGFCKDMEEYKSKSDMPNRDSVKTPANFVTTIKETSLAVVGPDLNLPNINKAFYRVVAVDENGNESGPSDYAEFPRPFVYNGLPDKLKLGQNFAHKPGVVASIGDLKCKGGYNAAFWDKEYLSFALVQSPEWLKIDPETGELSGMPKADAVGKHDVVLRVTDSKGGEAERTFVVQVTD
ncbi:putative Ig domain-containing protein [Candidatus Poribacteria bacterium]